MTGGVEAQSEEDAILDLREQGLYPTHLSREKVYQSVMRTKLFHFIAQTWDCLVFGVLTFAAISLAVFLCYVVSLMYKVIITSNLREPIMWIGVCVDCVEHLDRLFTKSSNETKHMCDVLHERNITGADRPQFVYKVVQKIGPG